MSDGPKSMGEIVANRVAAPPKRDPNIHSDCHAFVKETRLWWDDKFSFGLWLGKCKDVPLPILHMLRGDVEDSKPFSKAKLFFWKVAKWKKGAIPSSSVAPIDERGMKPDTSGNALQYQS